MDYAPIQKKISEPELKSDFQEFCRCMRIKWHFRNEPNAEFSNIPAYRSKSSWKSPKAHPVLQIFLSKIEKTLFEISDKQLGYSNFSTEEWKAMRSLTDDRNIVIKKADKGSCVVV